MCTHYHIWRYVRGKDGTIRSIERNDRVYPKRRQANYSLAKGHQCWKADQILQCPDRAFRQSLSEEYWATV